MGGDADALDRARDLHRRGVEANSAGRPAEAASILRAALDVLDGPDDPAPDDPAPDDPAGIRLRARVLMALAFAVFEASGLPAAEAVLADALTEADAVGDAELSALCHSQRANLLGRAGQMSAALDELDAAVERLDALDARDQFVLLSNRGVTYSLLGRLTEAAADAARAVRIAADAGLVREEAMALHNEGWIAYLVGDLPRALALMRRSEAMGVDVSGAVSRLDRGRVLLEAGLGREAVEVLTQATAAAEERHQHHVLAEIELELARAHAVRGDVDAAERMARAAGQRFRSADAAGWAARADLVLAQITAGPGGRPGAVAEDVEALIARAQDADDPLLELESRVLAAQAALDRALTAAAVAHLDAAEDLVASTGGTGLLSIRLQLRLGRAMAAAAAGRVAEVPAVLDLAADDQARAQGLSASLDLRTAIAVHGTRLAELDLALALPSGPDAVITSTERWRSVTARLPRVRPPGSPALASALADLRRLREDLRADVGAAARAELLTRIEAVEADVSEHARGQRDVDARAAPLAPRDPETLREALDAVDADLLSLVEHDGEVLAVVVASGHASIHRLGAARVVAETSRRLRADLQAAATHELGPMRAAVWSSLRAGLDDLDRTVVRPCGLARPRVVVVPHRGTAALPWGMLPSLAGRGVVVARSATAWARGLSPPVATPDVAAIGGPDLPAADEEVRRVADRWPRAALVPAGNSSAAALRDALVGADVVHVAAHGLHHQESPLFASVRMADGPLFVHDLELSGVGAAHVILSSCDVGRSTVRPGDEPLGLAAGMLALGARSVVAAVCRVPDAVAAAVMDRYHRRLAAGDPSDVALAAAAGEGEELGRAFVVAGSPWQVAVGSG